MAALANGVRRVFRGQAAGTEDDRQEFIRSCATFDSARLDGYHLYSNFYDGEQLTRLVDRARVYLEQGGVKFAENIVETAIDKAARRFHVEGFQVQDSEPASDWLTQELWGKHDELQGIVHSEVPKLGDGFVLVTWDEKRMRPRLTWNRPEKHKPVYDDDGEMLYDVKKWSTSKRGPLNPNAALIWRLNLYYPDRVEKWFSIDQDGENWSPWQDAADEPWPLPWTESGELPGDGSEAEDALGILVTHFREKPKGRTFGRSRVHGMIPYQNELNKQVLDLFYVMDAQGWAWPWITGLTDGDRVSLAVGDVLQIKDKDAKVGSIPAANPQGALEAIDATLRRFSAKTDTPLFDLIKGTPPSGEALKTAVLGQTAYVKDAQSTHGNSWENVVGQAWRLASIWGDDGVPPYDPVRDITTQWASTEPRSEETEAQTSIFYSELGVSNATLMRRHGFDPTEEAKLRALEAPDDPPSPDV